MLLAVSCLGHVGCAQLASFVMVQTPNHGKRLAEVQDPPTDQWVGLGVDRQLRVEVGPPKASLLLWVVEPDGPARGTVLMVHGYRSQKDGFVSTAHVMAEAGFRAVLIDQRGHGRSTGEYLTYGLREAHDLAQVIDALERRGLISGRLGVWGVSVGGSTAIRLASMDARVAAVVAVAPYADLRTLVSHVARGILPGSNALVPNGIIQAHLDEAALEAGFDPNQLDTIAVVRRMRTPLMVVHGTTDRVVPFDHGQRVYDAAPGPKALVPLKNEGHIRIHDDERPVAPRRVVDWFRRYLASP